MADDAKRFLLSLFDFEKERADRRKMKPFTLERVTRALDILGRPDDGLRIVHIAGTKGKGTIAEHIFRVLAENGKRGVGLFTSPHLVRVNERVRTEKGNIPDKELLALSRQVWELNRESFAGELTFFETIFLVAMLHFREKGSEWAVLETGLGGRLDATNAAHSSLSVLCRIDYDHQDVLGESLPQIAGEKAGIIKTAPVVALFQEPEVNRVFEDAAAKKNVPIEWVKIPPSPPLFPASSWENACVSHAACRSILPESRGFPSPGELAAIGVRGRLQEATWKGSRLLLDAAHNAVSMRNLAAFLAAREGPFSLCFAMAEGRMPKDLLGPLLPLVEEACLAALPGGRPGVAPQALVEIAEKLRPGLPFCCALDSEGLFNWLARPCGGTKVVCGSFYLVGAVLEELEKEAEGGEG